VEDDLTPAGFTNEGTSARNVFHQFLKWLDEGVDSDGQKYLEIRRRLVRYFERKNCSPADELADETLSRVARRLAEEGEIREATPAQYCYTVARFVFLECQRRPGQSQISMESLPFVDRDSPDAQPPSERREAESQAKRLQCLETCLRQLPSLHCELILDYYRGERRAKIELRRRLAERLGLTANALSIRACRIRDRLERCVRACCGQS
jgi:DNA-directed RNA polymerase specialized sigma24 family protein